MANNDVQQSALGAYRSMAGAQSGFVLLIECLRALGTPNLIANILISAEAPAQLCGEGLLQ